MVPFLRIVPIGGVCLTALVLVLALEPPGTPPRVVSPDMVLARGPLIDRAAHPEWPQMLVRAAYMRADEILKLRDLPNTPTQVAPIMLPPQRPTIATAKPAPPVEAAPQSQPEQAQTAPTSSVTRTASLPANIDTVKPSVVAASPAPAPAASAPVPPGNAVALDKTETAVAPPSANAMTDLPPGGSASSDVVATAPATIPQTDLAPPPEAKTTAPPSTAAVPMPEPKPMQVAALPVERATRAPVPDDDDITGTIADSSGATIPVDIGEASSTELPIVLPRERPAILRIRHQAQPQRHVAHPHRGKKAAPRPKLPGNEQPASQVNLFDQLFDNGNAANGKSATVKTRGGKPAAAQPTATSNLAPPQYNQFDMR